jgi:hypothetical protein
MLLQVVSNANVHTARRQDGLHSFLRRGATNILTMLGLFAMNGKMLFRAVIYPSSRTDS